MHLATLLNQNLIFFNVEGNDRETIYNHLISLMAKTVSLPCPPARVVSDIIAREDLINIVYEKGFAYPHIRYPQLMDLNVVIGVLKKPVLLKQNDREETRIIVCSLVSPETSVIYLKVLAAFSRYFLLAPDAIAKLVNTGSPKAMIDFLQAENIEVKHTLCAEDVMLREVKTVKPDDTISEALDIFAKEKVEAIPVVDEHGSFLGIISSEMIIRKAVPDYIMNMDNLNFLSHFEPFETVLCEEQNILVKDVMAPTRNTIHPNTPLIQFTLRLLKEKEHILFVVQDGKLSGTVSFVELVSNVLRG
ncbi:MAG: CBS domain protein [Lentisphaerae bacterium ADurb.Bin242]|nr:MAG: CBS domain protein [Lentisphaerae bacterium ADurb.Bin242]